MARTTTLPQEVKEPLAPWWWRHRFRLMPVYLAIATSLVGVASFYLELRQFWASWGALAFLWFILVKNRYGGRGGNAQKMVFHLFVLTAVLGLVAAIRWKPLAMGTLFSVVLVVGVILTIFWYTDKQNLQRVKVERELEAWPDFAENIGLKAVKRGVMHVTDTGRRVWLSWAPGSCTIKRVESQLDVLGGYFEIPVGQAKIMTKKVDGLIEPNGCWLVENTKSQIRGKTVEFDEPTMKRITDKMLIAPTEDNNLVEVQWYIKGWGAKHTISGGQTGSGKSSLFDLFFAESAYCPDLVRWGMDRKGGIAIAPWASMFDWQAITDEGCTSMLSALKEVLEERSKILAEKQHEWGKCWKASPRYPVLVCILDEAAEIVGMSSGAGMVNADLTASVVRRARQLGVMIFFAVQRLNLDGIGNTHITSNCARRFCFSVKTGGDQMSIIPGSADAFDATQVELPKQAGTFWWTDGGEPTKVAARVRYVNEEKIREIVLKVGDRIADLDPRSAAAAARGSESFGEESYAQRTHTLVEDLPPLTFSGNFDEDDDPEYNLDPTDRHPDDPEGDDDRIEATNLGESVPDDRPDKETDMPDDPPPGASVNDIPVDPAERAAFLAQFAAEENVSPEEAVRRLDGALDGAGRVGIAPRDLFPIVGMGRTWTHEALAARVGRGEAEVVGKGPSVRYRRPAPDLKVVK